MSNIEDTIKKLDTIKIGIGENMSVRKNLLYTNEETGTVVYQVFTDNSSLIRKLGHGEHIVWGYFLIGNQSGYAETATYVASEARFKLGQIRENNDELRIERKGTVTIHFGIEVDVGDIVLEKNRLKPYS